VVSARIILTRGNNWNGNNGMIACVVQRVCFSFLGIFTVTTCLHTHSLCASSLALQPIRKTGIPRSKTFEKTVK
jgi:hypothetical protein